MHCQYVMGGGLTQVRYTGDYYKVMFDKSKTYEVIAIEDGFCRVYSDEFEDDDLFSSDIFEVVQEDPKPPVLGREVASFC